MIAPESKSAISRSLFLAGGLLAAALHAAPAFATPCSNCTLGGPSVWSTPNVGFPPDNRLAWVNHGYPVIQVCPGPVVGSDGSTRPASAGGPRALSGPDCVFANLYLDVKIHPGPLTRIRDVSFGYDTPPGTWVQPLPVLVPSYECPLQFRVHFPPRQVNCNGFSQQLNLVVEEKEEFCNGQPAGGYWARMGYNLLCMKPEMAARVHATDHGWLRLQYLSPEIARMLYSVANGDQYASHTVNLSLQSDQPTWTIQQGPPSQITLGPMESRMLPVDIEVPQGTPINTTGTFTISASFADAPSPTSQDSFQLTVGDDPEPEPTNTIPINSLTPPVPGLSGQLLMALIGVSGLFGVVMLRRRRMFAA